MPHPIDTITKNVAEREGWDVTNAGEARVALALRKLGYRPADFATQFKLGPYKLDFALVAERIDIEADGWVHTARNVRRRDSTRDRQLRQWGWTVIRIDVDEDIDEQLRRKVPNRGWCAEWDATMGQIWAIFGVALGRLYRHGVDDPTERLNTVRDVLLKQINDRSLWPSNKGGYPLDRRTEARG